MKKIIGGIVAVLAVAIIGLSIYRTVLSYLPENENDYSEEVSYLNDEVDFKMYLYGEDINFPKELHYEKIADVDMEKINLDADYVYLIINDLNGTTDLKENDIKEIMALTEQKKNFNFFYIGKEKLKLFQKYKDDIDFQDTDWCNLLEYLTQRDIQTKNSGVNVRYRGKHRFFKGFNEFIKEKTRRCDNDFEKIERHVFF